MRVIPREIKKRSSAVSQNEQAYGLLHERLTTLVYRPGEYLNTAVLMSDLAMGRTPINHALHRLGNEGLIQIIPRKGVMVSPLSIDDALHMIDVRLVNEKLCLKLAAKNITKAEIEQLRSINLAYNKAVANRAVAEVMSLDGMFHEVLATASRNPVLIDVLRVLHARSQRFWAISLSSGGHMTEVQNEHELVVDALEQGDSELAQQAISDHVLSFRNALINARS
ncbi:MAG: GntR family transcriptional regulator [Comamonas sp.]